MIRFLTLAYTGSHADTSILTCWTADWYVTSRSNPWCRDTTASIRSSASTYPDATEDRYPNLILIENAPPLRQIPLHLGIVQLSPNHSRVQLHVSGATHIPPLLQVCWQTAKQISDPSNFFSSWIIINVRVWHKLPLYPGEHVHTLGAITKFLSKIERKVLKINTCTYP